MMKRYTEFHGEIPLTEIGKRLREIAKKGENFKIITGYGSTTGCQKSKKAALTSLSKMMKEGLIKGYLPGEKAFDLATKADDVFYKTRIQYESILKGDSDRGNDGVIYIFVK